jgi:hypothetical protein
MDIICGNPPCSKPARADKHGKPLKYCSIECEKDDRRVRMQGNKFRRGLKPANAFAKGHATWNKDMKGIHLSPDSEWVPGQPGLHKVPVGTVTIRYDNETGTPRAWIKVAEPAKWLPRAVVTWTAAGRKIPKGKFLHHKDGDATNDGPGSLDNLELVTRAEHLEIHRPDFETRRLIGLRAATAKKRAKKC